MKARQEELPLPAGLIGISAWTDLTASGRSYAENRDRDPSMTWERLDFLPHVIPNAAICPWCLLFSEI